MSTEKQQQSLFDADPQDASPPATPTARLTREEKDTRFAEILARVSRALSDHADTFEELHALLTAHFREHCPAGPVSRRDAVALRLPLPGEPAARLYVRPDCQRGYGPGAKHEMLPHVQLLSVEEKVKEGQGGSKKWKSRWLALTLKAEGPSVNRYYLNGTEEVVPRLTSVVRMLLTNPAEVFRLSHEWCCCCGRALTDPASIARGIGPECWVMMKDFGATKPAL